MDVSEKVLEIVENDITAISKKTWCKPSFEIISKDVVKSGGVKPGLEGTTQYSIVS